MPLQLPSLYVIADIDTLARHGMPLADFTQQVLAAGVRWIQLRDKSGSPQQVLAHAAEMQAVVNGTDCRLLMNDRADLALLAGWSAVHVGHTDLPPGAVHQLFRKAGGEAGAASAVVGVSTHDEAQVRAADAGEVDYIAVGPVFATGTKADAEPVIGLEGVRRARALTGKPLVAIGGITLESARSVRDAGADSVAIIGALFRPGVSVEATAREFLQVLA